MNQEDSSLVVSDDYVEAAVKEIAETVQQFSGMDGPQLLATLAGVLVATGRELFERLATVERALSIVDTSTPTRRISLPATEGAADVHEDPLDLCSAEAGLGSVTGSLQLVPAPVPVPPSADRQAQLEQVRQLEAMLEQLRSGGSSVVMTPAIGPASKVTYEVRHTDGSLVKHVPEAMRVHSTREAAEQAKQMVEATHPGWRDKLFVEEVEASQ